MGMSWTKEQQEVIDIRNSNVLVSAAAGSGKTAVLVERIIKRITEKEHPVDIDKLLVVTFTNAAAAEMRERIRDAIEKALDQEPENVHLQRQYTLLHNAQITTIDSFCLYILRNYFHKIDLEPAFRVGDEGELALLKSDVLDQVMEEYYEKASEEFIQFVSNYGSAKSDESIRNMILELFRYSQSYPWPEEWLVSCTKAYDAKNMEELMDKSWMNGLFACVQAELKELTEQMEECLNICDDGDGPYMYGEVMKQECDFVEGLAFCDSYTELAAAISEMPSTRLPAKRGFEGSQEKKELAKSIRDGVKAEIKKIKEKFFFATGEEILSELAHTKGMAEMLVEVTLRFLECYGEIKKNKNLVDFSDMEHFALRILVDQETKKTTEVADEFRKLYEEIMIDEYQDSNYVQEAILSAIARREPESQNMFMVGDVKQSIYRFRLARPELFMEKYEAFKANQCLGTRIDLHKNFRSREEVLAPVNDIFYKLLQEDLGRFTYDEDAAL